MGMPGRIPDINVRHFICAKATEKMPSNLDFVFAEDGSISWQAGVAMTADEAVDAAATMPTKEGDASEWLADLLQAGPIESKVIFEKARTEGIAERTLERAKTSLKVKTSRKGFGPTGGWFWELPNNVKRDADDPFDGRTF
jgi:hypothetical protein